MSKYVVFNILYQGIVGKEKKVFSFPFFFYPQIGGYETINLSTPSNIVECR